MEQAAAKRPIPIHMKSSKAFHNDSGEYLLEDPKSVISQNPVDSRSVAFNLHGRIWGHTGDN